MGRRGLAKAAAALALALCGAAAATAADAVRLESVLVQPDSAANRALVRGLAERALQIVGRRYAPRLVGPEQGQPAEYRLAVVAVLQDESSVLNLALRRGSSERTYVFTGRIDAASAPHVAAAVFHLGGLSADLPLGPAPVPVDELPTEVIARSALPCL